MTKNPSQGRKQNCKMRLIHARGPKSGNSKWRGKSNLPAGVCREASKGHSVWSAAWAWCCPFLLREGLLTTRPLCELNDQPLSHELCSVCANILSEIVKWHSEGPGEVRTYGRLLSISEEIHEKSSVFHIPGTTSRASISSSYSMNPKPFISLTSLMVPLPCWAKCASTSAFVATAVQVSR
jgi:hypothetical protein